METATAKHVGGGYPMLRGAVGIITILVYILAGIQAVGALACAAAAWNYGGFFAFLCLLGAGLTAAAITFFLAKIWSEASVMVADIADSITAANALAQRNAALSGV